MKLEPGTKVTPNVRLVSPLGQGAMGSVWVAEHLTLKTRVAVKFVSERLDPDDPEVIERFTHEASLAAQIKSSHVVQTFDQGVMRDGVPYIVMELLDGEGLGSLLTRIPQLPLAQVVKIVWQTAKALSSAHKEGIVHRDIKPDNIFLSTRDDELHIKVLDFGIAHHTWHAGAGPASQRIGQGTPIGEGKGEDGDGALMIGTPEFMSPELVLNANAVDRFADLWALAVVAYHCVTGMRPFTGKDLGELCVTLLEGKYAPPSTIRPEVPAELDEWFAKALAKERSKRFQNVRDLAYAFAQAIPGVSGIVGLPATGPTDDLLDTSTGMPRVTDAELRSQPVATLTGAASDTRDEVPRRHSSVTISVVAATALLAGVAAVMLVRSQVGEPAAQEPPPGQAAPPAASTSAVSTEVAGNLDEDDDLAPEASPAPSGDESDGTPDAGARPLRPKPWLPRPASANRPPRRPKDPGF